MRGVRSRASRAWLAAVALGLAGAWLAGPGGTPPATAAELSATEILERMAGTGIWTGSGSARLELVTENRRGQRRVYRLQIYRSEGADGSDRQLIEYLEPADVRGTKFLSLRRPGQAPEMWLYLPAVGRERRIAGADVQQQFMGTDFSYEEIGGGATYRTDYTARRLPDAELDGRAVYVLHLTPNRPDSPYGAVQLWVWKEGFVPLRIDFLDRRGQLEKQLTAGELRQDEAGAWLPHRITMASLKAQSRTVVRVLEYRRGEVSEEYFSLRYLRR